jgi:hypothetical protein
VTTHGLRAPLGFTIQERFRRPRYAEFQDLTLTEWNGNSNLPSELYKIRAGMFLYGYYSEEDRRYFLLHPYETTYARPVVQFEFYPLEFAPGTQVVVRRLRPGTRSRRIDDLIVVDVDTPTRQQVAHTRGG